MLIRIDAGLNRVTPRKNKNVQPITLADILNPMQLEADNRLCFLRDMDGGSQS